MAILFTPLCLCFLEETLKAVGPVYMLSMPSGNKRCDTKKTGFCQYQEEKPLVLNVV